MVIEMEEYYSEHAIASSTSKVLCIGALTRSEAEQVGDDAAFCDGFGYYLFMADREKPSEEIEVIAKLTSAAAAEQLSRLLSAAQPA